MNPFLFSFLKILTGLLGLMFWAAIKLCKDYLRYHIVKESSLRNVSIFPATQRKLFTHEEGIDGFMKEHHPLKVKYWDEIWLNGFRPIYILMIVQLFFYSSVPLFITFFIIMILLVFLGEIILDIIATKLWYKVVVLLLWILTYCLFVYSECEVKKMEPPRTEQKTTNDTLNVK